MDINMLLLCCCCQWRMNTKQKKRAINIGHPTYYILKRKTSIYADQMAAAAAKRENDANARKKSHDQSDGIDDTRKKLHKQKSQSASNLPELTIDHIDTASPPSDGGQKVFQKLSRFLRSGSNASNVLTFPKPAQMAISTKSLPDSLNSDPERSQAAQNGHANGDEPNPRRPAHHSLCEPPPTTFGSYDVDATITSTKSISSSVRQWKLPKYLRRDSKTCHNNNIINSNMNGGGVKKWCDTDKCALTENGNVKQMTSSNHLLLPVIVKSASPDGMMTGAGDDHASPAYSVSPCSAYNINQTDIIDIRSYISQSRSDISPYLERSDSYKLVGGGGGGGVGGCRGALLGDMSPIRRPRASTVALISQEHLCSPKKCEYGNQLAVPHRLSTTSDVPPQPSSDAQLLQVPSSASMNKNSVSHEGLSMCQQSSLISTASEEPLSAFEFGSSCEAVQLPAQKIEHLRKQSDLQLIRCLRDNAKSRHSYLVEPPISKWTLFFRSPLMENEFRSRAHRIGEQNEIPTIATPIYNTYIDVLLGTVVFFILSTALFLLSLLYSFQSDVAWWIWLVVFIIFSLMELFALLVFTKRLCYSPTQRRCSYQKDDAVLAAANVPKAASIIAADLEQVKVTLPSSSSECSLTAHHHNHPLSLEHRIIRCVSNWFRWHIVLGTLMVLPIALIILQYFLQGMPGDRALDLEYRYGFLMLVCIVHFCNFTQLNCWLRNILAVLAALVFVAGITINHLTHPVTNGYENLRTNEINDTAHATGDIGAPHVHGCSLEIYVDLFLVLILVWFLNREFEIGYRFSFYGNAIAENDRMRVQTMKNQADILLHNIIPKHVADHLKNTAKYSENHHNVAIIFASLINFNELYDESYLGGREYLRVLNELIGDFDELLNRPQFRCVEKIKTIGSTFMAASGLDNFYRGDNNNDHVNALMEFAFAMQEVVAAFNKDLLEFDLIMRIGFNVGDVTAGVIGTSKLHYDIWGDAVNVASRMDSTGVAGQIQVDKDCIQFLDGDRYGFAPRGEVFIKGKGDMEVYLVSRRPVNI